jgi:hypothetical protein
VQPHVLVWVTSTKSRWIRLLSVSKLSTRLCGATFSAKSGTRTSHQRSNPSHGDYLPRIARMDTDCVLFNDNLDNFRPNRTAKQIVRTNVR